MLLAKGFWARPCGSKYQHILSSRPQREPGYPWGSIAISAPQMHAGQRTLPRAPQVASGKPQYLGFTICH